MDMPVETVDGVDYIGILDVPSLKMRLPVTKDWSYDNFRIAPCRYAGSAYQGNLVIAAHNYHSHFGQLKHMRPGEPVSFTDMNGNVFRYEVFGVDILQPTDVEEMTEDDWDLTLFTCTVGGAERVTVRCVRK